MALFLPKCFYIQELIYINGEESLLYFIELYITMITAIYNGKRVYYANKSDKIYKFDVIVYTWKKYFHLSFYDFIDNINYFFRYKGYLPFYCRKIKNIREDIVEYMLEINFKYYKNVDNSFRFPNPNDIITNLMDRFCKINPPITTSKYLQLCKFVDKIGNRYISCWNKVPKKETVNLESKKKSVNLESKKESVNLESKKESVSSGPSLNEKYEQLEQQKDMYSSMLDYLHYISHRVSPDELIKQISEVHSIKVARHDIEENPSKKSRLETPDYD